MYDHAHELAKTLGKSNEFTNLKQAYDDVLNDGETKELFEKFRDMQVKLNEKQMQGEQISEEEVNSANELVEEVQQNERISNLLETEQRLNVIINEVSQIITKPLEELYSAQQ